MRYLVVTGGPIANGIKTEILDVYDPSKSCLLDDILPWRYWSAGGLIGTTPVICGGFDGSNNLNECLFYGTNQVITMNYERNRPSSVAITDSMFWITGGHNGNTLDPTEFISSDGAILGPTLPEAISDHCTVRFNDNGFIYLIGGGISSGYYTTNVWVANPSNEYSFVKGPSLITARNSHGCGTMSIGDKSIIVTAGGWDNDWNYISSVEILDPLSNQWVPGK